MTANFFAFCERRIIAIQKLKKTDPAELFIRFYKGRIITTTSMMVIMMMMIIIIITLMMMMMMMMMMIVMMLSTFSK